MLRDEIKNISAERLRKLKAKEEKRNHLRKAVHENNLYKIYQKVVEKKKEIEIINYERGTQKIINKLPNKLRRKSKKYDYVDIYKYGKRSYSAAVVYDDDTYAKYFLDKRGKDIIKFLNENEIEYTLRAFRGTGESYYTIRVMFY